MRRRDFLKQSAMAAALLPAVAPRGFALGRKDLSRSDHSKRVIIVGAGLAGLSAAYELTQANHDVVVLEARTRPGGRVLTLRDPFPEGLYVEAGAARIPDHHHFTRQYVEHFGLTLDPFEPAGLVHVYHVRGKRIEATSAQDVDWPYELTADERALGLNGMRQKYIWSMLDELGDVTDPAWPPPELTTKFDRMNRSDLWRS